MDELKLLEAINLIDDDLIKEADEKTESHAKVIIPKRNIYAIGSVAAAAIITIGAVSFYHAHKPADLLIDNSLVQPENSESEKYNPDNQNTDAVIDNPVSTTAKETQATVSTTQSVHTYEDSSTEQATSPETVTTQTHDSISASSENVTDSDNSQTQPIDNIPIMDNQINTSVPQATQPIQVITQEPIDTDNSAPTVVSGYYFQKFELTVAPDSDAYGAEEEPFVSIIVSEHSYQQLDTSEYSAYHIEPEISENDFGEYIGTIVELFEYDNPSDYTVSSKEPNLAGAEVYYYAPANSQAVIIVKKNEQCSIFVFNGMSASLNSNISVFDETFRYYSENSAEDIQNISFSVATLNGSIFEITSQGTIIDRNTIQSIVAILYQLTPEPNSSDLLSATPQWLLDAWDAYRANPDAYIREDIMLDITFNNGTVLKDISYQPYIGNGYVSGMQELTPEQNTALRNLLK